MQRKRNRRIQAYLATIGLTVALFHFPGKSIIEYFKHKAYNRFCYEQADRQVEQDNYPQADEWINQTPGGLPAYLEDRIRNQPSLKIKDYARRTNPTLQHLDFKTITNNGTGMFEVTDLLYDGTPYLILGTQKGQIQILDEKGILQDRTGISPPIQKIFLEEDPTHRSKKIVVAGQDGLVYRITLSRENPDPTNFLCPSIQTTERIYDAKDPLDSIIQIPTPNGVTYFLQTQQKNIIEIDSKGKETTRLTRERQDLHNFAVTDLDENGTLDIILSTYAGIFAYLKDPEIGLYTSSVWTASDDLPATDLLLTRKLSPSGEPRIVYGSNKKIVVLNGLNGEKMWESNIGNFSLDNYDQIAVAEADGNPRTSEVLVGYHGVFDFLKVFSSTGQLEKRTGLSPYSTSPVSTNLSSHYKAFLLLGDGKTLKVYSGYDLIYKRDLEGKISKDGIRIYSTPTGKDVYVLTDNGPLYKIGQDYLNLEEALQSTNPQTTSSSSPRRHPIP